MRSFLERRGRQIARDAGATAVEYALLLALLVLVLAGSMTFLTDRATDEYEADGQRAGAPVEQYGVLDDAPGGGTGTDDGSVDGGDGGASPSPVVASVRSVSAKKTSGTWKVEVEVDVRQDDVLREGATISGSFTPGSATSCTTQGNGNNIVCSLTVTGVPCSTTSISWAVTSATYDTVTTAQTLTGTAPVPNGC